MSGAMLDRTGTGARIVEGAGVVPKTDLEVSRHASGLVVADTAFVGFPRVPGLTQGGLREK